MVRIGFGELRERVAGGLQDVTDVVAETARSFYCGVYNDTPGWVLRNNVLVSPLARQVLGDMCVESLPPPPVSEYQGGQCNVNYTIFAKWRITRRFQTGEFDAQGSVIPHPGVPGAITNIAFNDVDGIQNLDFTITFNNGDLNTFKRINQGSGTKYVAGSMNYVLSRVDGLPDTCGSPPPEPENIPPPTDIDITTIYNTELSNGDQISYDVSINRDGDNYISFPSVVNVGGVAVGLDVTGISVGDISVNKRSGGGGSNTGDSVNDTQDSEEPEELPEEEIESGGQEEQVENLVALKVDITSIPANAKIVWGNGAPDLIYAGWVEFKIQGYYFPRVYIDFLKNYYPAPDGADGYAITIKKGYNATIAKIIEKSEES